MEQSVLATLPPLSENKFPLSCSPPSPIPRTRVTATATQEAMSSSKRWASSRLLQPLSRSSSEETGDKTSSFNDPWRKTSLCDRVTSRLFLLWLTLSSLYRDWSRQIKTQLNNKYIDSVLLLHLKKNLLFILLFLVNVLIYVLSCQMKTGKNTDIKT